MGRYRRLWHPVWFILIFLQLTDKSADLRVTGGDEKFWLAGCDNGCSPRTIEHWRDTLSCATAARIGIAILPLYSVMAASTKRDHIKRVVDDTLSSGRLAPPTCMSMASKGGAAAPEVTPLSASGVTSSREALTRTSFDTIVDPASVRPIASGHASAAPNLRPWAVLTVAGCGLLAVSHSQHSLT